MNDVMVFDVETTGLSRYRDVITTACWHFQGQWHRWVRDQDTPDMFQRHWDASRELVTFNGTNFDEKFAMKDLGVEKHQQHRDMMYAGYKAGLKGGLKKVATECGLPRPPEIAGMDGRSAVMLWARWKEGDTVALQLLSVYNAWDVWLTLGVYRRLVHDLPLNEPHEIPWKLNPTDARRLLTET